MKTKKGWAKRLKEMPLSIGKFFYTEGKIFRRRPSAWLATIAYLLALYALVAAVSASMLVAVYWLTSKQPFYKASRSYIGGEPGYTLIPALSLSTDPSFTSYKGKSSSALWLPRCIEKAGECNRDSELIQWQKRTRDLMIESYNNLIKRIEEENQGSIDCDRVRRPSKGASFCALTYPKTNQCNFTAELKTQPRSWCFAIEFNRVSFCGNVYCFLKVWGAHYTECQQDITLITGKLAQNLTQCGRSRIQLQCNVLEEEMSDVEADSPMQLMKDRYRRSLIRTEVFPKEGISACHFPYNGPERRHKENLAAPIYYHHLPYFFVSVSIDRRLNAAYYPITCHVKGCDERKSVQIDILM